MNPYIILEVTENCTEEEFNNAYRRLAKKYHPDVGGDSKKFQEITIAISILRDPRKRKLYDEFGIISDTTENEIEEVVITIIKRMTNEWLLHQLQYKKDINISKFFSECCERALKEIESKLKAQRERLKYLNKRISKISAACEKNIVAELISENIQGLKQEIVQLEEAKYVHSLVIKMSNKYTSEEEVEEVPKEDFLQQYSTKDAYVV